MLTISFESDNKLTDDFANNKADASPDARWFTASQKSLMFKEGSNYPDKFILGLSFSANKKDQDNAFVFPVGNYFLTDEAFFLDPRNRNNPSCDFTKLELITHESIDYRVKELLKLKAELKKND